MALQITTARLVLRRFQQSDGEHLLALDNDPEVMRYINGGIDTPRSVIENEVLPRFMTEQVEGTGFGFWAAEERQSGTFVGWFSLRQSTDMAGEAILGYRLRRLMWGQGYATEGAGALLAAGFMQWGVLRMVATTYEKNVASRRVLTKLGFALVRRFRYTAVDLAQCDTAYQPSTDVWDGDDLVYALTKEAWRQQISLH